MSKVALKINIAGRTYPLNVPEAEADAVAAAAGQPQPPLGGPEPQPPPAGAGGAGQPPARPGPATLKAGRAAPLRDLSVAPG